MVRTFLCFKLMCKGEFMKKLERLYCVLMMFLTLIGCSSSTPQTHDVIFQDSIRIDLGDEDVNTAEYVKRIDSYPISGSSIDGNKIHVSNITMVCPSLKKGNLDKLGKQKLIYTIGDEKYTVEANIVDSVKPVIKVKDDSLTFEVGKMKGINNYYSVSDNYDASKDIKVKVKNIDKLNKNKTGTYKLVIKAWDTSGNTASKKLTVIIKDTKKEQEEKQKEEERKKEEEKKKAEEEEKQREAERQQQQSVQQSQATSTNDNVSSYPATSNSSSQTQQPSSSTPVTKDYLFSQGYDMSSAPSACQSALMASGRSGSCTPLQDSNGIYLGMRLVLN